MEVLQSLGQRISRDALCGVGEALAHVLDVELTRETKALAVRMGCDDELDRLRVRRVCVSRGGRRALLDLSFSPTCFFMFLHQQGQWDELEDFLSMEARRLLAEQQASSSSFGSSAGGGGGRRSRYEEQTSAYDDRGSTGGTSNSGSGATPGRALLSEVSVQFLPQVRREGKGKEGWCMFCVLGREGEVDKVH